MSLVPSKSSNQYQKCYADYVRYCADNVYCRTEQDVLFKYCKHLLLRYMSNTVRSKISQVITTVAENDNANLKWTTKLRRMIGNVRRGERVKRAPALPSESVRRYLLSLANEGEHLCHKLLILIGLFGGLRCIELAYLLFCNVVVGETGLTINVERTKTNVTGTFLVPNHKEPLLSGPTIYKMYRKIVPVIQQVNKDRLFRRFYNGRYTNQPLGKNTVSKIPCQIAVAQKLAQPFKYTGHTFRATAATWAANNGATVIQIKKLGDWKSERIAMGYVRNSTKGRREVAQLVKKSLMVVNNSETVEKTKKTETRTVYNFNNIKNLNLTLNFNK